MDDPLRYFFDEHVDHAIAVGLQSRSIDVLTAVDAGRAGRGIPDPEQLAYASAAGRVLVSRDPDFVELAYSDVPHAGILLLQRPLGIGDYIDYLEYMAYATHPDEIRNQLIFCAW